MLHSYLPFTVLTSSDFLDGRAPKNFVREMVKGIATISGKDKIQVIRFWDNRNGCNNNTGIECVNYLFKKPLTNELAKFFESFLQNADYCTNITFKQMKNIYYIAEHDFEKPDASTARIINNAKALLINSGNGKIEDARTMLETGRTVGEVAGRQELHNMSLTAFLNHPLLGTNTGSDIGGHAYFMDRAGLLGLVGFIPLFLFFYYQIKTTYENLPNSIRIYYLIGVASCIILGFQKNMFGFEYWLYLFFLLPAMCILLYNFTKNQ